MKTIGIKLADGTFYPILEEGTAKTYQLDLTTVKDGQTKVQIDLYRSATGTMDDAEYVDTLEVTNLVPHPNGEVELHLSVGLNENNELDAKVVDEETGKQSETNVTLVSRTLAERSEPTNFELSETENTEEPLPQENSETENLTADMPSPEDFSFDDFTDDTANGITAKDESESSGIITETVEEVPFSFDSEINNAAQNESDELSSEPALETAEIDPQESVSEEPVAQEIDSLPEFENSDMFDNDSFTTDPVSAEESVEDPVTESTDSLGIGDFSDEPKNEDFSLPDFDEPSVSDASFTEENSSGAEGLTGYFDDPAFSEDPVFTETNLSTDDDLNFDSLDSSSENKISSSPAMDFSDLYDKETLNGQSSSEYEDDDEERKTHVPMIICIICAIICVIATILVLFIVPSKYNLIKSRNTRTEVISETVIDSPAKEEPVKEEPVVVQAPPAEEDKIVVAPEPEVVVPVPTPEPEKKKDVKYRIRWGDTLWDIADAYYKNPWRYPKIAKYNKIKNPDLIISGTDILIPFE